jgi:predicted permease
MKTFWDSLRQDVWYGLRTMKGNPPFTIAAVLTLAVGIGANTAIFSVIYAVLLKPLDYPHPEQLVRITGGATDARFEAIRQARSFSGAAASTVYTENVSYSGPDGPEPVKGGRVSPNFLTVLGLTPLLGRSFSPEDQKDGQQVAMISAEFWRRRFGGNPGVVGSTVTLAAAPYTIIGVLPPGMQLPFPNLDVWRPWQPGLLPIPVRRNSPILSVLGRLGPGISPQQANAELSVLNRRYAAEFHGALDARPGQLAETVSPLKDFLVRDVRSILWMLFGAVAFLLLMACANVASLILARATARSREFAVRAALGAGRGRLIAQQLTESLLLAVAGSTVGILLAWWSLGALANLPGLELPRVQEIQLNGMVLAFALLAAVLTTLIFGLAPSFAASRPDLAAVMKASGESADLTWRNRLALCLRPRGLLVVVQVGLSMVLLIGAALLMESLAGLSRVKPGFEPQNLLTMEITLPQARHDELVSRVEAIPGVIAAAVTMTLPMTGFAATPVQAADQPPLKLNERPMAVLQSVTPDYFRTLGIRLLRGRTFAAADTNTAPLVAIINESLAKRFWPTYPRIDPVGRHMLIGSNPKPVLIAGVAADVRQAGLAEEAGPGLYQAVTSIKTMQAVIDGSEGQRRSILVMLALFAATGLLLVIVGVYGVMAYSVVQRTREFGIRRSLGAPSGDVVWLVVRQSLSLALAGVALGAAGAYAVTRVMRDLLFQVSATDPFTFAAAGALMIIVALMAGYLPARRAVRLQPTEALRAQ